MRAPSLLPALVALSLTACGGPSSIVDLEDIPPGPECPYGGVAIHTGVDADGDGALSAEEIAETSYVCDGAPSGDPTPTEAGGQATPTEPHGPTATPAGSVPWPAILVDIAGEPPGERCPSGGYAISVGLDLDGDGALSPAEVDSTSYLCSQPGGDGAPPAPLVEVEDEPPGDACPVGGAAIHVGLDLDADGALDEGEITSTTYVCDGEDGEGGGGLTTINGSVQIGDTLDAAVLANVTAITGDLIILPTVVEADLSFPRLRSVGGDIRATSLYAGHHLSFPALTTVGGGVSLTSTAGFSAEAFMESLTEVSSISISGTSSNTLSGAFPELVQVEAMTLNGGNLPGAFPALERVERRLFVACAALPVFAALSEVGDVLNLSGDCDLESDPFPALETVGAVTVGDGSKGVSLSESFGALTSVGSISLKGSQVTLEGAFGALVDVPQLTLEARSSFSDQGSFASLERVSDWLLLSYWAATPAVGSFPALSHVELLALSYPQQALDLMAFAQLPSAGGLSVGSASSGVDLSAWAGRELDLIELESVDGLDLSVGHPRVAGDAGRLTLTGAELPDADRLIKPGAALERLELQFVGGVTHFDPVFSLAPGAVVIIGYMPDLESFSWTHGAPQIGGIQVANNPRLTAIPDLPGVEELLGGLAVVYNTSLEELPVFEDLVSADYIYLTNGIALRSIAGLRGLAHVGEDLVISGASFLADLSGLEGLRSVGGGLSLHGNRNLSDISALSGLESVGGDLEIEDNRALPQCQVDALASGVSVGGSVESSGNLACE